MILNEFDTNKKAVINPEELRTKVEGMPKTCVLFFSKSAMRCFLENYQCENIAKVTNATADFNIYKVNFQGRDIAVMHAAVGAPACIANTEELIALGAKNILAVGCCGCLTNDLADESIIIPTAAIRDEGTSYHYAPEYDETILDERMVEVIENFMKKCKIQYTKGKTWTTDAIFRETRDKVNKRIAQGAITVDMECSALNILCEFRGVNFGQFFYAADNLANETYDPRTLITTNENIDKKQQNKMKVVSLALECAVDIDKNFD